VKVIHLSVLVVLYSLLTQHETNNINIQNKLRAQINGKYNDVSSIEHVARMGETRNAYRISMVKSQGKRPLRRQRCRWVDNIQMDLGKIGWDGVDWIQLAQDRDQWKALVNTVMNLRVP
jgi:hypothetical protein